MGAVLLLHERNRQANVLNLSATDPGWNSRTRKGQKQKLALNWTQIVLLVNICANESNRGWESNFVIDHRLEVFKVETVLAATVNLRVKSSKRCLSVGTILKSEQNANSVVDLIGDCAVGALWVSCHVTIRETLHQLEGVQGIVHLEVSWQRIGVNFIVGEGQNSDHFVADRISASRLLNNQRS